MSLILYVPPRKKESDRQRAFSGIGFSGFPTGDEIFTKKKEDRSSKKSPPTFPVAI